MENHLNPGDPKSYALRGLVPRVLEYLYDTIKSRVENGGGKVRGKLSVRRCSMVCRQHQPIIEREQVPVPERLLKCVCFHFYASVLRCAGDICLPMLVL